MMIKPYFLSWWTLLTCLLSASALGLLGVCFSPSLLTNALRDCMRDWKQRDCVSGLRVKERFIQNPPVLALPHRFSCKPNMAASPLAFHAETYLWHFETAHVVGTVSSSLVNHREKIQYPQRKEKCLTVITWYNTSERVVTCCQYRWYHMPCVKEVWRVVSTDDITRYVWKSWDVL